MRRLALVIAALAFVAFLPEPAAAQSRATLTITLNAPDDVLRAGETILLSGTATYTADALTVLQFTSGIPVHYTVMDAPSWASVVVSPASDVFPVPSTPAVTYTIVRTFTVAITGNEHPHNVNGVVAIEGSTPAASFGQAANAHGAVPIAYQAPEAPCDEAHQAELLKLAEQAAETYARERASGAADGTDVGASRPGASDPQLITQDTGAKPLALPWVAVAGFGLVGAAVGLVLRKRLGR